MTSDSPSGSLLANLRRELAQSPPFSQMDAAAVESAPRLMLVKLRQAPDAYIAAGVKHMSHLAAGILHEEHAAVAAVLRSLLAMVRQGPENQPERFFDVLRAMLFYIDEFPEQRHHPKESRLLFPMLAKARPDLLPVIRRLEHDHMAGEGRIRELQHTLLAWEFIGESRRAEFEKQAEDYVDFYLKHMRTEEVELMPAAKKALSAADWAELDAAFAIDRDPLAGGVRDRHYDRLFTRIVLTAPAPIGVGPTAENVLHP